MFDWMDKLMDGWMDRQIDGWIHECILGQMNGCVYDIEFSVRDYSMISFIEGMR